jgi:uncharacterized protein YggE
MRTKRLFQPLILLVALVILRPLKAQGQGTTPKSGLPEVATFGSGAVTLSPQRATVQIGVSTHAISAAEASAQNATVLQAVLDTLVRTGFRRESLRTLAFGVSPNYDYANGRKVIDYAARSVIRVSLSDLSRVGRVIDMALAAGATEVGGLDYESDSTDVARHRALAQAFAKARDDATAVAAAAGGKLGRLLELTTHDNGYGGLAFGPVVFSPAMQQQTPPIMPPDVTVRVSVQTRWQFLPPRQ